MDQCIFGDHLKYGDLFIEKLPERVRFCMKCVERYPDNREYKGRDEWWISGEYGKWYYDNNLSFISFKDYESWTTKESWTTHKSE